MMSSLGTLFVVATPIGNLDDITIRAIKILRRVHVLAAEDTRHARRLLGRYHINVPLISYHEHNEQGRTPHLIKRLKDGLDVALISDAGTPVVSDPGFRLLARAVEEGIKIVPIPGPSALLSALCVSGLPADSFCFFGFLPPKGAKRRRRLEEISRMPSTVILYEAPHRILASLRDLLYACGDRAVVVARELTKVHEEIIRGPISQVVLNLEGRTIKGEFTVVMAGRGRRG
jgi:16S rRNA (cytidine1402-2'-O)-methyltransferase